jgi:hypothetical protein
MNLDGTWTFIADTEGDYTHAMTRNWDDHMWASQVEYDAGAAAPTVLLDIAPDGSVTEYDGSAIPLLNDYAVTDLETDQMGHLWCTTNGGGLLEIKPDLSYNVYTMANTGGLLPQDTYHHMEYKCGVFWIATQDTGIIRIGRDDLTASTGVYEEKAESMPTSFTLHTNYPNPFNPSTRITFDLKHNTDVHLAVYDIRGNLVAMLAEGHYSSGRYHLTWDGRDSFGRTMPSGVYLYRLQAGGEVFSRKMMLLK